MYLQTPPNDRTASVDGNKRRAARLILVVLCAAMSGCMALRLSSRGAPEQEMRGFDLQMEPLDLPAVHEGGHGHQGQPAPLWATIPVSGWLHGFDYRLLDAAGDPVPREVLHHFKVMAPNRRELFSPLMLRLVGAGQETTPVSLPRQIGYPVAAGDSLLVTAMLHNPTHRDLEGVRLQITLRYSPPGSWRPPLRAVPFFTHVTQPLLEETTYDLPPGRSHRSMDVTPAVSGKVLALGAHLHRYGVSVKLQDAITRRVIWETEAKRSSDGSILEIPQDHFVWSRGPTLRSDRTYRVTATYDNPTGDTIRAGGMSTLGGIIVPEEPWPVADRRAPEYVWDLSREAGLPSHAEHRR